MTSSFFLNVFQDPWEAILGHYNVCEQKKRKHGSKEDER